VPLIPEFETIRVELEGPVGHLTLNRPERLNAFTPQMWRELAALGASLLDDPRDLRALVVVGEGRAFSSGIDTSVFTSGGGPGVERPRRSTPEEAPLGAPTNGVSEVLAGADQARHPDPAVAGILAAQEAYTWLEEVPFATIAAVRGYALGAGLQLALACDVRCVARGTKLGLLEHKYGIIPDLGGTQRLPRLVGAGRAKELIFTAATIEAEDAERIGLAEHVVADEELEEQVEELAERIAAQPPLAVRAAKRAVHAAMSGVSIRDGLLVEAEGQATCLRSADMREALTAFVEQRAPVYRGR
jgi:enoyl-CoA hydratase/carnithine racemase